VRAIKKNLFSSVFSLICMIAVLTTVLNILGNTLLRNQIKRVGLREQNIYIDAYASSLDSVFHNVSNLMQQLGNGVPLSRVSRPGYRNAWDYLSNEQEIFSTFSLLSSASNGINSIFFLTEDGERCYTAAGIMTPETYFYNRYTGNYDEWMNILTAVYRSISIKRIPQGKKPAEGEYYAASTIYALQTVKPGTSQMGGGTLCVCIDEQFVESMFANAEFSYGRQIYVCNRDGDVIAANMQEGIQELLSIGPEGLLEKEGDFELPQKGLLSCRISTTGDLRYLIYTPFSVLMEGYDRFVLILNLFSVFLMVMLIILGYLGSRSIYRPVQNIVELLRENHRKAAPSEESETDFIKNRVLDIVSANYNLQSAMKDSSPLILETVLFKLMRGNPSVMETLESTAEQYGISFENGLYGAFVIRMELQTDSDEQFESLYDGKLHEIISAIIDQRLVSVVGTRPDEYTVVVYSAAAEDENRLKEAFALLHAELSGEIPQSHFVIGFGGYVSSVMELRKSYLNALNAIRHRHINDEGPVFEWFDEDGIPYCLPADFDAELEAMLRERQFDVARAYIGSQFEQNLKNNIYMIEYLQLCYTINGFLLRIIRGRSTTLYRDAIRIDPNTSLYSAQRLNEIVFFNFHLLEQYDANPSAGVESAIERVVNYVDEHFAEDINLTIVASNLGYTSGYISRLFKQARGVKFTDYLNRRRIGHSKSLLLTSNKTVKQIACDVGFNSATLFIRIFERYEGITPGEFRRLRP